MNLGCLIYNRILISFHNGAVDFTFFVFLHYQFPIPNSHSEFLFFYFILSTVSYISLGMHFIIRVLQFILGLILTCAVTILNIPQIL